MKIGIDYRSALSSPTGVGRYTYNLVKYLLEIDKENQYILFVDKLNVPNLNYSNIKYHYIKFSQKHLWEQFLLPTFSNYLGIDILHTPTDAIGSSVKLKAKYVVTIHDLCPMVMPTMYMRNLAHHLYYKYKLHQTVNQASHIFTVSNFSKEEIHKLLKVAKNKISVTYHGIPEVPLLENNGIIDNYLAIDSKYILGIGGSEYRKNNLSLVTAYFNLFEDGKINDYKLVIVGGQWRKNRDIYDFVKLKKLDSHVIFIENASEILLHTLYKNATLFVYPSLYEGFGIPLLEAMWHSLPIITSNVSSLPEVAGKSAIFIDPYNIDSIQSSILELLTNDTKRKMLISSGAGNLKRFSYSEMAKDTLAAYKAILSS